jgi:polyribonucleotide nucleotidyltransferase
VKGLSNDILKEALEQAKKGRLAILEEMNKTISTPREDHKPHAPRIKQMRIGKEFIGAVIGPGGKIIQELQNETGAKIVVEEVGEEGVIDIVSEDKETTDEVVNRIKELTAIPEEGETYEATVKRIMPYGAFMEFLPGKEGLLHISEISWSRINDVNEVFEVGDKVKVKLLDVDDKTGKYTLSRKRLIPKPDFSNQEQQQTKE